VKFQKKLFVLFLWLYSLPALAAINQGNGNFTHAAKDYSNIAETALSLARNYNSGNTASGPLGQGWSMSYLTERLVVTQPETAITETWGPYYGNYDPVTRSSPSYSRSRSYSFPGHAVMYLSDGKPRAMNTASGSWKMSGDTKAEVTCVSPYSVSITHGTETIGLLSIRRDTAWCDAFTVRAGDGALRTFSPSGYPANQFRLTSLKLASGWSATLAYDSDGRLSQVTSSGGRTLVFTYNANGTLSQITGPGGYILTYTYDAQNNLSAVSGPSGWGERYQYQNSALPGALTEIDDAAGNVITRIGYDAQRRAIHREAAQGLQPVNLVYNANGSTSVADATGRTIVYQFQSYQGNPLLTEVSGPCGSGCSSTAATQNYDDTGRLLNSTDFNGNSTYYEYDPSGNQITTTFPNGLVTVDTYDPNYNRLLSHSDATGVTTYAYDSYGNLLTKTLTADGQSLTWSYTYDALGHVTSATAPRTGKTTYTYDAGGALSSVTNALGHTWTVTSGDAHGRPLSVTTPAGETLDYAYDGVGRLTAQTLNGAQTTFSYTPHGKLAGLTRPDGSSVSFSYNSADLLIGVSESNGAGITYNLDDAGRPVTVSQSNPAGSVSTQTINYDSLSGNVAAITNGLGDATTFTYDPNGNLASLTDPLNRTTSYAYDGMDALLTTSRADGYDITAGYNPLGKLTSLTTPDGQVTNYTVNGLGQTTRQQSPDTGISQYTYYPSGLLKTRTDARGKVATYTYDAIGRTTGIAYSDGPTIAYTYDTSRVGSLSGISGGGATLTYGYDSLGRVGTLSQTVGAVTKTITYLRDAAGKLTSLTTPSGQIISFAYADGASQPSALNINGAPVISQFIWLPFKNAPQGWQWANGANHMRTVDAAGRTNWVSSDNVLSRQLGLDAAGNITAIADALLADRSQTFSFDAIDQLIGETSSAGRNYTYSYDANGNRVYWQKDAADTIAVTPGYTGNILSSLYVTPANTTKIVTHDATGNLLNDGARTYTYDSRGRLLTVKKGTLTTTYQYNGLGQRVSKTGTIFMYDLDGHLLGEYDSDGNLIQETVWVGDLPVATLRPNGAGASLYYVNPDELGSPRVVTNTSNQPVWRWDSDAFGNGAPNEDPRGTGTLFSYNLRFPGQYYDKESGLHYNYFRDYDPATGRYVQSNPIGLAGGANTYTYVNGNPVSFVDPYGLDTYVTNRDLSALGTSARPWSNPLTHTFTFSTNPDGSVVNTYSWGNAANLQGWNLNQPEDIKAAAQALQNGDAQKVAPSFVDPYYRKAFDQLNKPENNHANGVITNNCKTETVKLNDLAWKLLSR